MKRKKTWLKILILIIFAGIFSAQSGMRAVYAGKITDSKVKTFCIGASYGGAITKDGNLYMWGNNDHGQIGNGTNAEQSEPVKVLSNVKTIHLAYHYAGAITEDGSLYMWGNNADGQIGNGTTTNQMTPVKILSNVKTISCGGNHVGAITEDGSLYTWGSNYYGENGNGTTTNQSKPVKVLSDVIAVSMGSFHSGAITKDGSLYMWGQNGNGQIGDGTTTDQSKPVKVLSNIKSVCLGSSDSAAIAEDGSLYMWGYNDYGQIGNGTTSHQKTPVKILSNVKKVTLEDGDSAAITENGDLYMWGFNGCGQIGNGTTSHQKSPVKILSNVKSVSIEGSHSGAVTEDDSLYMWGRNDYGQVGDGTNSNQKVPVKVLSSVNCVSAGCSGSYFSGAVTDDGSLYMWGRNNYGQIGNGNYENQMIPVKVLSGILLPGEEKEQIEGKREISVRFFRKWDAQKQIAYFDNNDSDGCEVTEETDSTFAGNVDSLLGKYVLVESVLPEENEKDVSVLISVKAVESKLGTVIKVEKESVTIGRDRYGVSKNLNSLESYADQYVLYHIYDGKVVGIEKLISGKGTITYWDSDMRQLTVKPENSDESEESYTLSILADKKYEEFLGKTGIKDQTIHYTGDKNHFLYRIGIIPKFEVGKDNFSFTNSPTSFMTWGELEVWNAEKNGGVKSWSFAEFMEELGNQANYQITDNSFFQLCRGMEADVVSELEADRYKVWGGSCYGMSITMALRSADPQALPIRQLDPENESVESTHQLEEPKSSWRTEDVINYYQLMYNYPYVVNRVLKLSKQARQNYQEALDQFLEAVVNDETPTVVAIYSPEPAAHSVIVLDVLKECKDYFELKVYDPNYEDVTSMYLYKNGVGSIGDTDDKLYGLRIKYNGATTSASEETGYTCLYNYVDLLKTMDLRNYFDSNNDNVSGFGGNSYTFPSLKISGETDVALGSSREKLVFQNGCVKEAENVYGPYMEPGDNGDNKERCFVVDSDNPEDEYIFKFDTKEKACNVKINMPSWSVMISGEEDIEVKTDNGEKEFVVTSETPTMLSVLYTRNEGSHLPEKRIAVDVKGSEAIGMKTSGEGILIASDDLNSAKIVVETDGEKVSVDDDIKDNSVVITTDENGNVILQDVQDHEHMEVEDKAVAATCTAKGKTAGKHCLVCGAVLTEQKTIAAFGHKWSEWSTVKKSTYLSEGVKTRICKVCGKKETTSIGKLCGTTLTNVKNKKGKKVSVSWKKNKKVTGYQIQYATNSKFKGAKIKTVKGAKSTSYTLSKLKKGKTYYVRVRTYTKKNYSGWSKTKTVKIKK